MKLSNILKNSCIKGVGGAPTLGLFSIALVLLFLAGPVPRFSGVGFKIISPELAAQEEEPVQGLTARGARNSRFVKRVIRSRMAKFGFRTGRVQKLRGNRYRVQILGFNSRKSGRKFRGVIVVKTSRLNRSRLERAGKGFAYFRVSGNKLLLNKRSLARAGYSFNKSLFRKSFIKRGKIKIVGPSM